MVCRRLPVDWWSVQEAGAAGKLRLNSNVIFWGPRQKFIFYQFLLIKEEINIEPRYNY